MEKKNRIILFCMTYLIPVVGILLMAIDSIKICKE